MFLLENVVFESKLAMILSIIFVKKFGKFWEVADFKDFVTNGKV